MHLIVNLLLSSFMLVISNQNYPGGLALMQLHATERSEAQVHGYIKFVLNMQNRLINSRHKRFESI